MSPVTCLDSDHLEDANPNVVVRRHPVDWNDPAEGTQERALAVLSRQQILCVYFNPAFTVTCPEPTPEFFREVRKRQAEWCRRADQSPLSRWARRRVSRWGSGRHKFTSKSERYFHRAFCFTGVMFINGQLIHPNQWKRFENDRLTTHSPDESAGDSVEST